MDTGEGRFKPLTKKEIVELDRDQLGYVFYIGEEVKVKDSLFRVKSIKPTELRLKLLPRREP